MPQAIQFLNFQLFLSKTKLFLSLGLLSLFFLGSFLLINQPATPKPKPQAKSPTTNWTLIATGDIIPARSVNAQSFRQKDYFWPYQKIAPFLKQADLTVINLEAPDRKSVV